MEYPAPDGTLLHSSPDGPVVYTCAVPNLENGTFESYETSSRPDNTLQQIKIVRVMNNGQVTITITERTPQEIAEYFQNIEQ